MYERETIGDRLMFLRSRRGLTLQKLSKLSLISASSLGEYERNETKDIPSSAIKALAQCYEVSTDYLLGLTDNEKYSRLPIADLHLTDSAIEVLKNQLINTRLLSEIISLPAFRMLMADCEVYVDGHLQNLLSNMEAQLELIRRFFVRNVSGADVCYLDSYRRNQISEPAFFYYSIYHDLVYILDRIRSAHTNNGFEDDSAFIQQKLDVIKQAEANGESIGDALFCLFIAELGIEYSSLSETEVHVLKQVFQNSVFAKPPKHNKEGKAG